MLKRTALLIPMLAALTAAPGFSAELTGKWTGGKSWAFVFTFQQDGSKLTGEVQATPARGVEPVVLPISNGRIDSNHLSFEIDLWEGSKLLCDGIVNGEEIQLNARAEGPGMSGGNSVILKRAR